jgi:DNA repair exonuclease SbcCD ATPase subunit
MRLLRLSAHFGVLDGAEITFAPGLLNLVVDANERGKSTFVAAIVAALYGLLPGNRGAPAEHNRFQPLTGGRFDVELDVESGGRRLRIRRDFLRGSCTVGDLDAVQDLTASFQSGKSQWDIGQALLGLSREQFLRSALVRQGEISGLALEREAATLTSRIQQLVDSNAGDSTADAAIGALDAALRGYDGVTFKGSGIVDTEIKTLSERIEAAERRLEALRDGRTALDADAEQLTRLHAAVLELRRYRDHSARLADGIDAQQAVERLRQDTERRAHREALKVERERLAGLPEIEPGFAADLAALDGAIGSHDHRLEEEQIALAEANARSRTLVAVLAGRERFAGATAETAAEVLRACERLRSALDAEAAAAGELRAASGGADANASASAAGMAAAFERLLAGEIDDLSRYGERRSALLSVVAALPAGQSTAPGRPRPALLFGLGIVAAGVALLLFVPLLGVVLALAGGGLVLWSLLSPPPAPRTGEPEWRRDEMAQRLHELDGRIGTIARGLGCDDIPAALDGLRRWQESRGRHEQLRAARRLHADAAAALLTARQAAEGLLGCWGKTAAQAAADLDPGLMLALHEELNGYLRDRQALVPARTAEAALRERVADVCQEREQAVAAFARATGAEAETQPARTAARERFAALIAALRRRQELDAQLAEVDAALLSESERSGLTQAAAAGAAPPREPGGTDTTTTATEHRAEVLRLSSEAEALDGEARDLQGKLALALTDFEREYPAVEAQLVEDRAALVRARGFAGSAGLARELLAEVARDTHRDWSRRLNDAAGDILGRFATEHTELRFSEQLDFVVRDRESGREWPRTDVKRRLSAGARDQIYLAIRFALAAYFSPPSDPLPLVLDDPLVTSDDARFTAVMSYLVEQAQERQVILLTCHAERHAWWLRTAPDARHAARLSLTGQPPSLDAVC